MLMTPDKPHAEISRMSFADENVDRAPSSHDRPRVVILGGGFAGLSAARALAKADADVILIDRRGQHVFQPLLYRVAASGWAPAEIAAPLDNVLSRQDNASVLVGEVHGIDKVRRVVRVGERDIHFDYLVVATGARAGRPAGHGWERFALGLKTVEDALAVRARIRRALEQADATANEAERRRLMTLVVIGAGPTGVELAGAVAELLRGALESDFRGLDAATARVVLVESAIRVLPSFAKSLSSMARRSLQCLGVELRLGVPVSQCDAEGVVVAGKRLPSATVFWAGGVAGSPAAEWLKVASDASGRVVVAPDLSLPDERDIFVAGDTARVEQNGQPLPAMAAVAQRQGAYVAQVIAARIAGTRGPGPFRYRGGASVVTIGRKAAVAQFGALRCSGGIARSLWVALSVWSLIRHRNRAGAILGWSLDSLVRQGSLLGTGHRSLGRSEARRGWLAGFGAVANPRRVAPQPVR